MKTIIFTFAVLAASGYLAYSQSPKVHQVVNSVMNNFQNQSGHAEILEDKIIELQTEVARLKEEPFPSMAMPVPVPVELDGFIPLVADEAPKTTMGIKERSDALQELAERMELKALAQ